MGHGVQLIFGTVLWGALVVTFPQVIVKFAVVADSDPTSACTAICRTLMA
jgi:hypothetical protein